MADFRYVVDKHLIIVPVILTGPTGSMYADFILDTGAAHTIVDHSLATAIGYTARDAVGHSKVRSAVGEEKGYRINLMRIESLDKVLEDFEVACHDLLQQDVQGLLGMTFLERYRFTIDPHKRIISIG